MPPETMQLRSQLLSASPYLSDTVMVNAAEKEDVLPNSIVTEILAENPQSAKAENVLNKLNERTTPPNDNQMAQIHANDTVLGEKEALESKKAYYASRKQQNVNDLVRLNMSDTTITAVYDSIESALAHVQTPESYYLQAFARYNNGDSTGVINKLSDVTSVFDLSSYETGIHSAYEDYFGVLLTLQSEGKNITDIDSTQKATLYNIVQNSGGLVQALARNILIKTGDIVYNEPYIFPDTTQNKTAKVKGGLGNTSNIADQYFTLYPNPAKQYLTFEYKVDYKTVNPVIEIYTLTGMHINTFRLFKKQGVKIIDLRDYTPGTYLIRLSDSGNTLQSAKFVKY